MGIEVGERWEKSISLREKSSRHPMFLRMEGSSFFPNNPRRGAPRTPLWHCPAELGNMGAFEVHLARLGGATGWPKLYPVCLTVAEDGLSI
jgi:hypothetical protein